MVFTSRRAGGTGRFLEWKIRLFAVAAVLLLVGMAREIDLLVLLAIALLAVAFALRFFEREPPPPADEEDDPV
jgi:membrane protein implicated in regulation of membrane protease activity